MKVVLSIFLYIVALYLYGEKYNLWSLFPRFTSINPKSLSPHYAVFTLPGFIFFLFSCLYFVPEIHLLFQFPFNSYISLSYNSTSELADVFHPQIFPIERIILVTSTEPLNPIYLPKCLALKIKDNPFKSWHISFWPFQTSLPQLLLISEAAKVWTTAALQCSAELPKPWFWARLISAGRPLCRCGYASSHPRWQVLYADF